MIMVMYLGIIGGDVGWGVVLIHPKFLLKETKVFFFFFLIFLILKKKVLQIHITSMFLKQHDIFELVLRWPSGYSRYITIEVQCFLHFLWSHTHSFTASYNYLIVMAICNLLI